ncbi:MAG: hypothetical protein ABJ388_07705 [Alphaproteobacteria bacterium]
MAETATAQADPGGPPPEEGAPPEGMDAGTEPGDGIPSAESLRPVLIKDRFAVDPKTPLPDLDSPSAKAFMAEDRRDIDRPVFALICNPGLPTRLGAMTSLRGSGIKALVGVLEWEVEFWPLIRQRTMILILERPLGGRVLQKGTFRISEYDLPRKVIEPLAGALQEMASIGVAHRAIRRDNLFFMDAGRQQIAFGECYSSPPGYDQPAVYEPAERAMAPPAGRGVGNSRDDAYAFAVAIVGLILDKEPGAVEGSEKILAEKLELGSYAAITGNENLPLSLLEPLRGMLGDDPQQRWGPEEIDLWLSGRKMSPQQKRAGKRGQTPLTFMGRPYQSVRQLADAFSKHVPDAAKAIRHDSFDTWLRRSVEDVNLANAIKNVLDVANAQAGSFAGSDEMIVTRVAILMDPLGPIRFKGFSFMVDGFGAAFAMDLLRTGDPQIPAEIIAKDIPDLWFQSQLAYAPEASIHQKNFSQLKIVLNNKDPGFGIERCLYESNPSLPCQSPLLLQEYVLDTDHLLPALDRAANTQDLKSKPLDRHVAAFITARFKEDINPHLKALASENPDTQTIGMLSLLAFIQWKLRVEPVYGLASWVGGHLGPAINAYHSRSTRKEIEREIPRLVRRGSLPELFDLMDNADRRREDIEGFEDAVAEFTAAELEIQDIEGRGEEQLTKAERTGQQAAAMGSILVTMCIVMILFMIKVF